MEVSVSVALVADGFVPWLKRQTLVKYARRAVRYAQKKRRIRTGPERLRRLLTALPQRRIVVGSADRAGPGWIATEQEYLDLVRPETWATFFPPNSLDAILAEHVWEHLTPDEARIATDLCYLYLKPGGYLRVAVPDGFHPSAEYQSWVRVGGALPSQLANDHHVLYTHRTLGDLFTSAGFRVQLYEYYDEAGTFHCRDFDVARGKIWRSRRYDPRNRNGQNVFTSVILDAVKP
jgi:predicted SAM-dependent methyltransferase